MFAPTVWAAIMRTSICVDQNRFDSESTCYALICCLHQPVGARKILSALEILGHGSYDVKRSRVEALDHPVV